MNKLLLSGVFILLSTNLLGQINREDSTMQVVGYWDKNEKQTYEISYLKYKIQNEDTLSREYIKYDVDITIKDSTATSYTIEWFYKNFTSDTDNELLKKVYSIAEDMPVVIKTDEFGALSEVVNWEEVRDYITKSMKIVKQEFKNMPEMEKVFTQLEGVYTTKESIEANAIKDILQFYTYHGGKYTLGEEITAQMQFANNFGGKPFDADVTVSLDEIDSVDENAILRMYQTVNSNQLTDETYNYLLKTSQTLGTKLPPRDEFPPLQNEIWTASRIHGPSGWIIYSIETKEVSADNVINVEEREIELK